MMSKGGLRRGTDSLRRCPKLLLVVGLGLAILTGCGTSMKNTTPTIAFASGQLAPPPSVMASSTVQFAANVSNDSASAGVSWMVSCGAANMADCGSISRHTASGAPSTFIAPLKVPPSGSVTITANASTDPKQGVSAKVQITPIVYGPITVAFPDSTPASVMTGSSAAFIPVVTNDHLNDDGTPMGVTLKATCNDPSGQCGSVQDLAYMAPPVVPAGGTVTITATSKADPSKSASTKVTITRAVIGITLSEMSTAVPAGAAMNLSANVSNDLSKKGVDWSASCLGGGSGGSFKPAHTDPKPATLAILYPTQVTSYAAPASGCPSNQITITATSTTDAASTASLTIQVAPVVLRNDLLKGQYAFLLNGVNLGGATALAGSLIADGNGNIVSAQESQPGKSSVLSNISGTYFVGVDGRGTITLSGLPFDRYGGWNNGQQVFKIAVVSPTHVLVQEFDGYGEYALGLNTPLPSYGETLAGTLDSQKPADFGVLPSGSYSFIMSAGTYFGDGYYYYGGVLATNGSGPISSVAIDRYYRGITDCIASDASSGCNVVRAGSFTAPDSYGHGTVNVIGPYSFDYYMVDAGHLIVTARTSTDRTGYPAGRMYPQGTPGAISGSYAFTMAGAMPLPNTNEALNGTAPQAIGGQFSCDILGKLTGYLDTNSNGQIEMAAVTGTCAPPGGNGRGKLTINGGGASQLAVYATADSGLLMFQLDPKRSAIGVALPQSTNPVRPSTFQGKYAASFQRLGVFDPSKPATSGKPMGAWFDFIGQAAADGFYGFSAKVDVDRINGTYTVPTGNCWMQKPDANMTGTFTVSARPGRFTGLIDAGTALFADPVDSIIYSPTMPQIFYVVNDTTVLSLESGAIPGTGIVQKQQF